MGATCKVLAVAVIGLTVVGGFRSMTEELSSFLDTPILSQHDPFTNAGSSQPVRCSPMSHRRCRIALVVIAMAPPRRPGAILFAN